LPTTGEAAPSLPPTASDYSKAGLPWFEYYDPGAIALPGSGRLAKVKSVKAMSQSKGVSGLPENHSAEVERTIRIRPSRPRHVRKGRS
jgi:hypothetical protein